MSERPKETRCKRVGSAYAGSNPAPPIDIPGAANGVALQSDGAIVAAGAILDDQEGDGEFALLRLTAAGVPDDSFGVDGEVTTEFAGGDAQANAVTVLSRRHDSRRRRARYGARLRVRDRALLTLTARSCGRQRPSSPTAPPAPRMSSSNPIASLPSETVNTPSGSARFALAGYTLEGDLDPTFGNGGTQDTAFVGGGALGRGAVLASTGQILVAGDFTAATGNDRFALARYTADGQLDITFQTDADDDPVQPEQRVRGRRGPGAVRGAGRRRPRVRLQLRPSGLRARGLRRRRDPQPRVRHGRHADDTVRHR